MAYKRKNPVCGGAYKGNLYSSQSNPTRPERQGKSFAEINRVAVSSLSVLLMRWLPDGKTEGHEYVARNPKRADHHAGSFKINLRNGKWADFATGDKGGDPISLAAYLFGLSQNEAKNQIAKMLGV